MVPEIRKIRVLLTKGRLDAHNRGVKTVARSLMNEGMEVIYTEYRVPEDIVSSALQEDVDVIGISFSSGGQVRVTDQVLRLLKKKGMGDKLIIVGGSIPPHDVPRLKEIGVSRVFRQGDFLDQITNHIRLYKEGKAI